MKYQNVQEGIFIKRPNRFIAHVEIGGEEVICHVKNTGRCRELLIPGTRVFLQKSDNPDRKTAYDLIGVMKGEKFVNMDSQIPNRAVEEWLREGNLVSKTAFIRPETTFGSSRFDFYLEDKERKIFIEVKGVTLEEEGIVRFPDAPTERGVKHIEELCNCIDEGYEAYIIFVVQMSGVIQFEPNEITHPEFAEALRKAVKKGVQVLAYDCKVKPDEISIQNPVKVILERDVKMERLADVPKPLMNWYEENKRELPWRSDPTPYHVWVSEIMLQQTRVEAVKGYYGRFLKALPGIEDLAKCPEEELLKLWEGLGYYNRVKNMQKAACQIMDTYDGQMPEDYDKILTLPGIGSYTAGAVSSIAYGIPRPAVDGNVLRVVSRILEMDEDILKQSVKKKVEEDLLQIIPKDKPGTFNQAMMELGATVCVPNGMAKCEICPIAELCQARAHGTVLDFPKKAPKKKRRIEKKTVLLIRNGDEFVIHKRENKGLLAGLYELPNLEGWLSQDEAVAEVEKLNLMPLHIENAVDAKHIFSHVEWHMRGYIIRVASVETKEVNDMIFVDKRETKGKYPIPSAFSAYRKYIEEDF